MSAALMQLDMHPCRSKGRCSSESGASTWRGLETNTLLFQLFFKLPVGSLFFSHQSSWICRDIPSRRFCSVISRCSLNYSIKSPWNRSGTLYTRMLFLLDLLSKWRTVSHSLRCSSSKCSRASFIVAPSVSISKIRSSTSAIAWSWPWSLYLFFVGL